MMIRKLLLCSASLSMAAAPAIAQSGPALIAPAPGEFGPRAAAPDGLTEAQLLALLEPRPTHVDGDAAPDNVGAFRFICEAGQVNADDPVVYPNQKGASHPHQFFGKIDTDYRSTYESGRASHALTTCQNIGNNSSYWMPAMLNGDGKVIRPDHVKIYYKRFPKGSPQCTPGDPLFVGECVGLPNGLEFVFGYDMITGTVPTGDIGFLCFRSDGTESPPQSNMVDAAKFCRNTPNAQGVYDALGLNIGAPPCWDGNNLTAPNHRSHLANTIIVNSRPRCPATHPKLIPHFEMKPAWTVDETLDVSGTWEPGRKTWTLSSDIMYGTVPKKPGTTFHGDYREGWNPFIKKMWTDNAIDRMLNASQGDLGNGWGLKDQWGLDYKATPRIVERPAMAREPFKVRVRAPQ